MIGLGRSRAAVLATLVTALALALGAAVVARDLSAGSPAPGHEEAGRRQPPHVQSREPRTVIGERPNIVLIMVDDMRADDLPFMPRTRRLLGGRGVRFDNAFAPNPLCCPARASVLTGLYTHNHGVYSTKAPYGFSSFDDRSTLATWLQDAGYTNVYLGKYLNGYGRTPRPGARTGHSRSYVPPGWDRWYASIDGGLPAARPRRGGTYDYFNTTISRSGDGFRTFTGRYQTRVYGALSARIIRRHAAAEAPYFLHASYTAPHHGEPHERDDPRRIRRVDGTTTELLTTARPLGVRGRFDDVVTTTPADTWRARRWQDKPPYLQVRPRLNRAERAGLVEVARQRAEALWVLDQEVARTLRAVDASGEAGETAVLFTSDNGYFLGEQRVRQGKSYPHDPSLRVPLLVRGPGVPAGERRSDPFTSIDIAPTLASWALVSPPAPLDGVSLLPVARKGDRGWSRGILTDSGPLVRTRRLRFLIGLRTPGYLYVDTPRGRHELYDLRRDPRQRLNLAGSPAYAAVQGRLASVLGRLRRCEAAQCRAPLPPSLRAR